MNTVCKTEDVVLSEPEPDLSVSVDLSVRDVWLDDETELVRLRLVVR